MQFRNARERFSMRSNFRFEVKSLRKRRELGRWIILRNVETSKDSRFLFLRVITLIRIDQLRQYGLARDERNLLRNDFSKTKRILLKKILGDIRLKYRTVWGKKFNFRYRSNYFTKRRISSKRKIESPEHHPSPLPEKRSPIPSSNDRKTQETQSLISEKDVLKSNFPSKMSRSKKKKKKETDRTDIPRTWSVNVAS